MLDQGVAICEIKSAGYRPIKRKLDVLSHLYPSGNKMTTATVYDSLVNRVLAYLDEVTLATAEMILEATGIEPHQLRRMISDKILTTSLNHNHKWLTSTRIIREEKNHWGFIKRRLRKWSRKFAIFHIKRKTKQVLSYLVSRRPWGLTSDEAEVLLGFDCSRALRQLVEINSIQIRICQGEELFVHRVHKRADIQVKNHRTNPRFKKEDNDKEDEEEVGIIKYEEYCKAFQQALNEMDNIPNVPIERITALLLQFNTNRSLRTMETWIKFNPRIRDAIDMACPVDHTTLSRAFTDIGEGFLKELFHLLVLKLHSMGVITGKFIVVDATHIYAYCNTRKDTNKHPIEGASWGYHHGSFYGYKVHILIDAESEMPISMVISTGKDYDSPHFIPLLEDFDEQYEFGEVIAILADGAYDTKSYRKTVRETTGGKFLPACNPRRSKILKVMKRTVKNLFDKHGDKIHTVKEGFRYLGQKFMSDYGGDPGTPSESKLVELIAERIHRHFRAGVERVFSRLKSLASFEKPKTQKLQSVKKTVWFCLIGQLIQALTAKQKGFPGSMRKRTALV